MIDKIIDEQEAGNGLEVYNTPKVCIGCGASNPEKCDGTLCKECWGRETNDSIEND